MSYYQGLVDSLPGWHTMAGLLIFVSTISGAGGVLTSPASLALLHPPNENFTVWIVLALIGRKRQPMAGERLETS